MDTILFNGNIHTLDQESPRAEAILIRDGFIRAVGSNADVLESASPDAERIDLGGRLVLPGFTDSHMHGQHEPPTKVDPLRVGGSGFEDVGVTADGADESVSN